MVSMATWYYTLGVLPMGISVTLNYMSPIFLGLILMVSSGPGKRPSLWEILCIIFGFMGVVLILDPMDSNLEGIAVFAVVAGVAASFVAALAFKDVKVLKMSGQNEWQMVFYFSLVSAVVAYPMTATARFDFSGHTAGYAMLLLAGVFGALGQLGVSKAFGSGNQILSSSMQYMSVIFSLAISWFWLGERVSAMQMLGIMVIVSSAIMTFFISSRKPQGNL